MVVSPLDSPPSPWVERWLSLVTPGTHALDVACGGGRHSRLMMRLGLHVTAVDRDTTGIADLTSNENATVVTADLEDGPWPFRDTKFAAIVVTNYLYRPLFPALINSLLPGGIAIYETFALGNEAYGKPSNPNFLLRPGELLDIFVPSARVVAYEDLYIDTPKPALVQRICAIRH